MTSCKKPSHIAIPRGAAIICGYEPGPTWTVVWDNVGHAPAHVARFNRDLDRRKPLALDPE